MKSKFKQNKAWLLATARAVALQLKEKTKGTRLSIRIPSRAIQTRTDGWSAVIGNLGQGQPRLEIWFDRITGYSERKLYACFFSSDRQQITAITKRISRKLWPVRTISMEDIGGDKYMVFSKRLKRSEFSMPILEKYHHGYTFYGIYDPTRLTTEKVNRHFCTRAMSFFEDVARVLPHATGQDEQCDVYSKNENRKTVVSHLHRERSGYLSSERKLRDDFKCQVCGFEFKKFYGRLGSEFAEAHHRVPLNKLRENVRTQLADLVTVCANCHRMLHRMDGRRSDIPRLRTIVRKNQGRRA